MSEPKNTQTHTPTPWVVRSEMPTDCSDGTRWTIVHDQPYYDRPTRFIASMCGTMPTIEGESESNAALIVRAVNAHEQLVDALETFQRSEVSTHVESYVKWCRESGPASHVETTERERICRAAYLAGWSAMWSSVSMQVEAALRAARGEK